MVTKYANLIRLLPSAIYKTAAQAWYDRSFPRHIFLELTSACNLSCDYCPRPKETQNMDWRTFKRIIDESRTYGPRSFSLHLFGEPLLYPRIIDACSYIKRSCKANTILLTTNGTLLEKYRKHLNDVGVDKIIWSYKTGQVIPKEAESWKNVTIRFMEGEEQNFPRREIRKMHNYGGNLTSLNSNASTTDGRRYPCYHLWYAPAVSVNGDILICCADPLKKTVIGNIKTMTLSKAWKIMESHRKQQMAGRYEGICSKCDVWKQYPDMFFSWQRTM